MRKNYWPNWSFAVVTILGPQKIKQSTINDRGSTKWLLDIDLRDESYGIYSNAGKRFLRERFGAAADSSQMLDLSSQFFEFMNPKNEPGKSIAWGQVGEIIPIRWASGGYLPIVRFEGQKWVQLFVRDIFPVGLNIANGASENKEEYKILHRLIGREFSEETILLSASPRPSGGVYLSNFVTMTLATGSPSPMRRFINPEFAARHAQLRSVHDDVEITASSSDPREISLIRTPFEVRVTYHDSRSGTTKQERLQNIIYSLNPGEFGIEIVLLCTFDLHTGEYLLDGEYDLSREVLIRRPIILLNMEFLHDVYSRGSSLGSLLTEGEGSGCKLLPEISNDNCRIFDIDIVLKHSRLRTIEGRLRDPSLDQNDRVRYEWEAYRINRWFDMYGKKPFSEMEQGLEDERLRSLCPVAWKTLEAIFAHQIAF